MRKHENCLNTAVHFYTSALSTIISHHEIETNKTKHALSLLMT